MKLQIWAEIELSDAYDQDPQTTAAMLMADNHNLLELISSEVVGHPTLKTVISCGGARVLLEDDPRMICPRCQDEMMKLEQGPWLFFCPTCQHHEGRLFEGLRLVR